MPIVGYVVVVSAVTFAKKNSTLGYVLPLTISNWSHQSSSENKKPEEILYKKFSLCVFLVKQKFMTETNVTLVVPLVVFVCVLWSADRR